MKNKISAVKNVCVFLKRNYIIIISLFFFFIAYAAFTAPSHEWRGVRSSPEQGWPFLLLGVYLLISDAYTRTKKWFKKRSEEDDHNENDQPNGEKNEDTE